MNTNTVTNDVAVGHELYFDSSTAMLRFNDQCTRLDHKTFKLLCYFVAHHDEIIERRALMNHLWKNQHASDASLGRLISVLRKILAVNGHKFIFTIHKTGYRFVIPEDVRFIQANPTVREVPASNIHIIDSNIKSVTAEDKSGQLESQSSQLALEKQSIGNTSQANGPPVAAKDSVKTPEPLKPLESQANLTVALNSINAKHWLPWYFLVILLMLGGIFWYLTSNYYGRSQTSSEIPIQSQQSEYNRIVILPFENLSEQNVGQKAQRQDNWRFVEGVTAELVNSLININGLQVVDKHDSAKYTSGQTEASSIANELQARYVLKGNVRAQGDDIRLSVQIVDSKNENTLISSVFEPDMSDGFNAQIMMAEEIAKQLQLTLAK